MRKRTLTVHLAILYYGVRLDEILDAVSCSLWVILGRVKPQLEDTPHPS